MNKKLHVLFISSWYPSKVFPTNGDFVQRHAEAVHLLHNVSVLHIVTDKNIQKTIIDVQIINGIKTYIGYVKHTKNPLKKGILFFNAYKQILKKIGTFDIIHLNVLFPFGIFALHQKIFKKRPFIITEHWTDYKHPLSTKISFIQRFISKKITKKANFVCPVSKDLQNSMKLFGLQGNYHPIPNTVDTNFFTVSKEKEKTTFRIVHISNMVNKQKNITGILEVISKLQLTIPYFDFLLIGENSHNYKEISNNLKINPKNIQFINHISHDSLVNYLKSADLFILFSNYENLPCVILEAFSCGVPVISTKVGGIDEYFPNKFGKLIPPKDEGELLKEIIHLYDTNL